MNVPKLLHYGFISISRVELNRMQQNCQRKAKLPVPLISIKYILFKDSSGRAQSQYFPRTNNKLTISKLGFKQEIMFLKTYYFSPLVAHNFWFHLHGHKLKASFAVWDEHMEIQFQFSHVHNSWFSVWEARLVLPIQFSAFCLSTTALYIENLTLFQKHDQGLSFSKGQKTQNSVPCSATVQCPVRNRLKI